MAFLIPALKPIGSDFVKRWIYFESNVFKPKVLCGKARGAASSKRIKYYTPPDELRIRFSIMSKGLMVG